jgi:hypothetical protein
MMAERGSNRNPNETEKFPEAIQEPREERSRRPSAGICRRRTKAIREKSNEADAAAQAIVATSLRGIHRPTRPTTRLPASGMIGINQIIVQGVGCRV